MAQKNPIPAHPGQMPALNKVFREFKGLNTQAAREAIEPDQFAWLENLMPIGFGNLKVVYQKSGVKTTLPATAYYRKSYDIAGDSYMFYACTDGSAHQVKLSDFSVTEIAMAGNFPASGTQIAQWKNERILIINSTDYYDWNGSSLTVLGNTSSAPVGGNCIATYAGHVWISSGRTINYSKPNSYTDFGAPGGNTIITDETLTSDITQLLSANNYLYFFGDDSINIIADVQLNAAGTSLLFSNTNISANSGTDLAQAIFPYYRAILYMNESGIFGLYGATPRKISDELDGIFPLIDFTAPVTAGSVQIYNILCAAFMFTYNDPAVGTRKVIALFFNKKWFIASQGVLIGMATNHSAGADTIYGDDGRNIYTLFDDPLTNIDTKLQTALWDFGEFLPEKQSLKIGVEVQSTGNVGTIMPTVDTEYVSQAPSVGFSGGFAFTWTNSLGQTFTWTNSLGALFTWVIGGYVWFFGDVETQGHYLGITVTSEDPKFQYIGLQLQYRKLPGGWWS